MGDKKDDSGLFGWKNWKIPDEWTVVARDRTPVSVSSCPAMIMISSVIVLMKLRSSRIYLTSRQKISILLYIQLNFIFFLF